MTLLAAPERLEIGWWSLLSAAETEGEELALREDYVAQSLYAGLLWVCQRPEWYGLLAAYQSNKTAIKKIEITQQLLHRRDRCSPVKPKPLAEAKCES